MLLAHTWRIEHLSANWNKYITEQQDGWFDTVMVNRLHIIDNKTKMCILI